MTRPHRFGPWPLSGPRCRPDWRISSSARATWRRAPIRLVHGRSPLRDLNSLLHEYWFDYILCYAWERLRFPIMETDIYLPGAGGRSVIVETKCVSGPFPRGPDLAPFRDWLGGRVTPPVRPHHRAYGSVHGGSSAPLQIPELSQNATSGSVVRSGPCSPVPVDARVPAHGDFRPPPSGVVGASQFPGLRLRRHSRPRHRAGFTCSGLGSLRRPFCPLLTSARPSDSLSAALARGQHADLPG